MGLKGFWNKPKKRIGTPKSDSLNFSVSDSENSFRMEMMEVNNEAGTNSEPRSEPQQGEHNGGEEPPAVPEVPAAEPRPAAEPADAPPPTVEPAAAAASEDAPVDRSEPAAPSEPEEVEASAEEIADVSEMSRLPQEPRRVMPIISADQPQETPMPRPRRSRATTVGTTPQQEDSYESQELKEREEAMIRLWRRATTPKKLPYPSLFPGYLKEPPELSYEETSASIRRRNYNETRIKGYRDQPFKRDDSRVKHVSPKLNRTVELRAKFIRREPLVSQYFSEHYNLHKKPPFKNTNVKYYIGI